MFKNINQSFEESKNKKSWFMNEHFDDITNEYDYNFVQKALNKTKSSRRIEAVAYIFNCDKDEVCIISRKKAIVNGNKTNVICTLNTYNAEFKEILMNTGTGRFDQYNDFWKVEDNDDNVQMIKNYLTSSFNVVIDCESMKIMRNKMNVSHKHNPEPFLTLDYHIKFSLEDLMDSIFRFRPNDYDEIQSIYVYNGQNFINFCVSDDFFWSQSPFLLFRYNIKNGQPRYVVYSTIGRTISDIIFHNDIKDRNRIIAKFRGKGKSSGNVFIKDENIKIIPENKKNIMELRKEFLKYKKDEEFINSFLQDCYAFPLSNDYIDTDGYIGEHKYVGAYVSYDYIHMEMSKNIAKYFGYHDKHKHFFPIIFNSENMKFFDEGEFMFIMIHEIAHHIVSIGKNDFFEEHDISECNDSHNLSWIFSNNILHSIIVGRPIETSIEYYRYEITEDVNIGTLHEIIDAVVEVVFHEIVNEGYNRPYSLEYFFKKVQECLWKFKDIIEND